MGNLSDIVGGALGYIRGAMGLDDAASGGAGGNSWDAYAKKYLPSMPDLPGGGGDGGSTFPDLPGGGDGASGFPALPGGGASASDYALSDVTQAAYGMRSVWAPKPVPQPGPAPSAAPTGGTGTGGTPGAGFGSPTPDQLEGMLTGTKLAGYGQTIADLARQYGVPAPLVMGILKAESSYSTPAGGTLNNFGGLKVADGSGGFADFPDIRSGLEAVIRNMGSSIYHGLSLQDYLNKYLGGYQGGDPEQYYGNVTAVIRALGGSPDYGSVPVGAPQAAAPAPGGGRVSPQGYSFPVVGYQGQIEPHHGSDRGAADIMAPAGTAIVAMRGGRVIDASYNTLGGNTVTILGDDGLTYYYAHMQGPATVREGQTIGAGTGLGAVGNTGNAANTPSHLHLGIGYGIASGAGPHGGAGENFDATNLLQGVLAWSNTWTGGGNDRRQ